MADSPYTKLTREKAAQERDALSRSPARRTSGRESDHRKHCTLPRPGAMPYEMAPFAGSSEIVVK